MSARLAKAGRYSRVRRGVGSSLEERRIERSKRWKWDGEGEREREGGGGEGEREGRWERGRVGEGEREGR